VIADERVVLQVTDRGDRYVPAHEELWVTDTSDAWLLSLAPAAPADRDRLGVFRAALPEPLLEEARRIAGGAGSTPVLRSDRSDADDPAFADWYAQVRALAREHPWSVLALGASTAPEPAGATVRLTFTAAGSRPVRVLVDRESFALVDEGGVVRHRGAPPDALWTSTGEAIGPLFSDVVLAPGQSAGVALFGVPDDVLPARASVGVTLAVATTEPDDGLPFPQAPAVLETAPVGAAG
jgi:hypothetical protein